MVAVPFLFYPVSKTIFLAFDLVFPRPPGPEDFENGTRGQAHSPAVRHRSV